MGVTQFKEGFNRLKSRRTSAESDQHSGRPQTARNAALVEKVENLIVKDRHTTRGCEICSQASDGGTEKFHLAVTQNLPNTINAEAGFLRLLAVLENEYAIDRIMFSE
ncbi:hypothetical protein TNCV_4039711 [Trichonephila clavipes]|nr:hypothetical protein TNCV_4039711 [Trichonephila clavipes]